VRRLAVAFNGRPRGHNRRPAVRPPFPGMDPWLELPALWQDVHNRLVTAIADDLASKVAPKYFVGVAQHAYVTSTAGDAAVIRPDVLVRRTASRKRVPAVVAPAPAGVGVIEMDIELPMEIQVEQWYLEVRLVGTRKLVTVIEVLSPWNKSAGPGRREYLKKRRHILKTRTSLVEIDLLRTGRAMPMTARQPVESDYRIVVGRGASRPRGRLYAFGVRQPIPPIPIPLLPKDPEPSFDLNAVLHALYERARFDLVLDYSKPPVPPLVEEDAAWAREIFAGKVAATGRNS
jgi:uncharacterized protein DUF4058